MVKTSHYQPQLSTNHMQRGSQCVLTPSFYGGGGLGKVWPCFPCSLRPWFSFIVSCPIVAPLPIEQLGDLLVCLLSAFVWLLLFLPANKR